MKEERELFDVCKEIVRQRSIEVLKRSAEERKTLVMLCSLCSKFMGERPARSKGGIERSLCTDCVPFASALVH